MEPFVIRMSCFLLSLLCLLLYCSSLSSELIFVTFVVQRLSHPPTPPVFTLPPNFSPLPSPNFRPLSSPHASPPLQCLFCISIRPVLCHHRLKLESFDLYRQQRSMDQASWGAILDLQPCHHPYSWSCFNSVCLCVFSGVIRHCQPAHFCVVPSNWNVHDIDPVKHEGWNHHHGLAPGCSAILLNAVILDFTLT